VVVTLAFGLAALVTSTILALLATRLSLHRVVTTRQLGRWQEPEFWSGEMERARRLVTSANIQTLASLRQGSVRKAALIERAMWGQIAAFALLAIAVLAVLLESLDR
jgi:hypothetical protein